jgi:hypothetical protein
VILAWLLACRPDAAAPASERTATLVYTNNVDGEIEPCG